MFARAQYEVVDGSEKIQSRLTLAREFRTRHKRNYIITLRRVT